MKRWSRMFRLLFASMIAVGLFAACDDEEEAASVSGGEASVGGYVAVIASE